MSRVFVVDTKLRPLHPCTPARARLLLKQQKAAVLTHRGEQVRQALTQRRAARRSRRARHTRYRQARFANRQRPKGWLPPSLRSRRDNVLTWVARLRKWCPVNSLSLELVKFDTQLLQQPDLAAEDYQFGTLAGCELRGYVLTKWNNVCAYCGAAGVPLELDHVVPRSRGGSHRESNRVPACHACNQKKGNQPLEEFLQGRPALLQRIQAHQKTPLADAAALNSLRWALYERLQASGLPVEAGSGGRTKWNRTKLGLPKAHWIDAAAVGASTPAVLHVERVIPLLITATGRQRRQMVLMDEHGFPRSRAKASSCVHGFRTGDIGRAVVTVGKQVGNYSGRVAVRASGFFNITTKQGTIQGVAARYCTSIQRADGYSYKTQKGVTALLSIP